MSVVKVHVTISYDEGNTLEQGDAARVCDAWWEIGTRTKGNIMVEVRDQAGNVAWQEA